MIGDVLLVIDMQTGVLQAGKQTINQKDQLLASVNQRIALYRAAKRPIIFIRHREPDLAYGTSGWQLSSALDYLPSDEIIEKTHTNSFYQTDLNEVLQQLDVQTIEFCGAQTEFCLDTTIKFAHGLGYHGLITATAYSTYDNAFLTAKELNAFYRQIWKNRFLTVI